jgi:hypothetical protein
MEYGEQTHRHFLLMARRLARRKAKPDKIKWLEKLKPTRTTTGLIKIILEMDEA